MRGSLAARLGWHWNRSLRRQFILGIALVHALLMTVFVWDLARRERTTLRAQHSEHAEHLALALARSSGVWVLSRDRMGLEELISLDHHHLHYAMILSPEGEVLAHSDREKVGLYLTDSASRGFLSGPPGLRRVRDTAAAIDVAAPIFARGALIGWVRVAVGREDIAAAQAYVTLHGLAYTAVAILIGSLFAAWMARSMTLDLERLVALTGRYRQGDLHARAPLARPDELGSLGRALHEMADELSLQRALTEAAQGAMRTERERLAVTLASIGDGVIAADAEDRVVLINPVACTLTGWEEGAAVGQPLQEVFPLSKVPPHEEGLNPQLDRILLPRGGALPIPVSLTWSALEVGVRKGRVVVFHDARQSQRARAQESRIRRLESVGALAGGIAHDFNNVLTGIIGNLGLALSLLDEDRSQAREAMLDAEAAGTRARSLTSRLLVFAKGGEPVLQCAHLAPIVEEVVQTCTRGTAVRAVFRWDPALQPALLDGGQFAQAIKNLVQNAIQAMPEGGNLAISAVNTQVAAGDLLPAGAYVQLTLRDEGPGISARDLPHIFEPYFSTRREGHGLGLTLAQAIVLKHRGDLRVESTVGVGSAFQLLLPAAPPDARLIPAPALIRGATVLLLEDEEAIRALIRRILTREGFRVLEATEGAEAVALTQAEYRAGRTIEVAILDLTVPNGMGGQETAPLLRAVAPKLRLIVSSGYSADPVMASPHAYGFAGVLPKPYTRHELLDGLARVLADATPEASCSTD